MAQRAFLPPPSPPANSSFSFPDRAFDVDTETARQYPSASKKLNPSICEIHFDLSQVSAALATCTPHTTQSPLAQAPPPPHWLWCPTFRHRYHYRVARPPAPYAEKVVFGPEPRRHVCKFTGFKSFDPFKPSYR